MEKRYGSFALALGVVLLVWSASAALADRVRTRRNAAYTEFLVIQEVPQPASLTLATISRLDRPAHFGLVFALDGAQVDVVGPHIVNPHTLWTVRWPIPPAWTEERLSVTLVREGVPYREVHLSGRWNRGEARP